VSELKVPLPPILEEVDGEIRVKGHRISLYHVITAYNEKWISAAAMVFHYPTLSLFEIEKVLEFYHANQQAVLEYVAAYKEEMKRLEATFAKGPSRAELIARFEAMNRERTDATEALAKQG